MFIYRCLQSKVVNLSKDSKQKSWWWAKYSKIFQVIFCFVDGFVDGYDIKNTWFSYINSFKKVKSVTYLGCSLNTHRQSQDTLSDTLSVTDTHHCQSSHTLAHTCIDDFAQSEVKSVWNHWNWLAKILRKIQKSAILSVPFEYL